MSTTVGTLRAVMDLDNRPMLTKLQQTELGVKKSTSRMAASFAMLKTGVAAVGASITTYLGAKTVGKLTSISASFEKMQGVLDQLTGGQGTETLKLLNEWALDMPVNTQEAVKAFVKMQAMGLDPTMEKMQILVDTATIFGEDALPRVSRALGQMAALGKLSAEELNQLSEVGINARGILSDAFGMSVEELQKAKVPIDEVIQAIWDGLEGKVGGASKNAMDAWKGVSVTTISYLREIARMVWTDTGAFDVMKDSLKSVNKELKKLIEWGRIFIKTDFVFYIEDMTKAWKEIKPYITAYGDALKYVFDNFHFLGEKSRGIFAGYLKSIVDAYEKMYTYGKNILSIANNIRKHGLFSTEWSLDDYKTDESKEPGGSNFNFAAMEKNLREHRRIANGAILAQKDVVLGNFGKDKKDKKDPGIDKAMEAALEKAKKMADHIKFRDLFDASEIETSFTQMHEDLIEKQKEIREKSKETSDIELANAIDLEIWQSGMLQIEDATRESFKRQEESVENFAETSSHGLTEWMFSTQKSFQSFADAIHSIFRKLAMDIVQEWIKSGIMNMLKNVGMTTVGGTTGGATSPGSNADLAASNNFNRLIQQGAMGGVAIGGFKKFAFGSPNISQPTLGLIGEGAFNEAVVPLPDGRSIPVAMQNKGAQGSASRNNNYFIQAMDSESFVDFTTRNPGAILGPLSDELDAGGSIIETLKDSLQ